MKPNLEYVGHCDLPGKWGAFQLHGFVETNSLKEHLAITLGDLTGDLPVLTRIHSECLTGDALFSLRCDCGAQLEEAFKRISDIGRGVVLYLRQEGRGIGLINKLRAYQLQDAGADTVEANQQLGFKADLRTYGMCQFMLSKLGVNAIRLMTNNPLKVEELRHSGVKVDGREPILAGRCAVNNFYLDTKQAKLGHLL